MVSLAFLPSPTPMRVTPQMVSLIQSLYTGFGSGLVAPSLGFALQSRGALFSLHDESPNVYAPGKRPFHTIMPGFASRGADWRLAYGVMGGFMQPQGHAQVLSNLIDAGMNVQEVRLTRTTLRRLAAPETATLTKPQHPNRPHGPTPT